MENKYRYTIYYCILNHDDLHWSVNHGHVDCYDYFVVRDCLYVWKTPECIQPEFVSYIHGAPDVRDYEGVIK